MTSSSINYKIKIKEIEWNENLSITSSPDYLLSLSNNFGWLSDENETLFIPFFIKSFFSIKIMYFEDDVDSLKNNEISREEKICFLNDIVKFIKGEMKVDLISQPPAHAVFSGVPKGVIYAPFGSYRIDLLKTVDELWSNVHTKHRNVIRNAQKNNVEIKSGIEYLPIAVDMVSKTLIRSKLSGINFNYIQNLAHKLEGQLVPYVSVYNDNIQGVAIYIYSKKRAYYVWGGSKPKPFLGSVNLLHWTAIQAFKNEGVKCYDFVGGRIKPKVGSKLESIQRFKNRFGGDFYKGYLWKYPITLKSYLFIYGLKFYYILKGRSYKDIIDQEK